MTGPKVVTSAYDFLKWAIQQIAKFPKNHRYTLGSRVENRLLGLMDLPIEAQYSSGKVEMLKRVNLAIEQLRYLFRLCFDLQMINSKSYEQSSKYLMDIGIQIGGWIKQQQSAK